MNRIRECHTVSSKSDREGETLYNIPYMWNLKKKIIQMNLLTKQTHKDCSHGCRGEGWGKR